MTISNEPVPTSGEVLPNRASRRAAGHRGRKLAALGSGAVLLSGTAGMVVTLSAAPAGATTFTVLNLNDSGADSLRQAIIDANGSGGEDTITFDPSLSGTINLASDLDAITEAVDIQGPGPSVITVDGGDSYQGFYFSNVDTGTPSISGLTAANLYSDSRVSDNSGGAIAIYYSDASFTFDNVVLDSNLAENDGGGLWCNGNDASVTITNSLFSDNIAHGGGGGLYFDCNGDLTVTSSRFTGNHADDDGGALYVDGSSASTFAMRNTTVSGSTTDSDGGGVYLTGAASTISNSTVANNTAAGYGGGIAANADSVTLLQTTISGNTATNGLGDGLYLNGAGPRAVAESTDPDTSTNAKEQAKKAAKASGEVSAADAGAVTITGTIIAANVGGEDVTTGSTATVNADSSLFGGVAAGITVTGAGNQTGVNTPGLGPLANNGGPTQTMALLASSPALDAGPATVPAFPGNGFDQRGAGYPRVVNGKVDVGAYEFQPIAIVPRFTG